jgi:hypothetical protein
VPFTPFHFGPAFGLGLPLRRYLHVPTFLVANVMVDVEPIVVLILELNYPLHGYLHTFIFASLMGLALGYVMFNLDRVLFSTYKFLRLDSEDNQSMKTFIVTGVSGAIFHVLLDSPLYSDIRPLYPFALNPFYDPSFSLAMYSFCVWMGIVGLVYYIGKIIYPSIKIRKSL